MDFIYELLANFYLVFLVLGIVFAVALLGMLSKTSKRKEEKKEEVVEEVKPKEEAPKESTLTPQIQPPGSLVIDTPHKPVEEEPEIIIEPSLDDLEIKPSTPEPTYSNQNAYQMNMTQNSNMMVQPQMQPMQSQYMDPNMQYQQMNMMQNPNMMAQPQIQPMQPQYMDSNMQYQQMNMMQNPNMLVQPQMQPVQQQPETIEFIIEEPKQEVIATHEPNNEVTETIEFFEIEEPSQPAQNPVSQNTVELRKVDINQAKALEQELASKQPVNTSEVYDAEPTFGLVIEDTGSSIGTNV